MRAKFINEKFQEKSDPIKDMGIGKFKLEDLSRPFFNSLGKITYNEIEEAEKRWYKYLSNLLNGKTITATLQRYPSMKIKEDTIKVKRVIRSEYERYYVKGEDGAAYRIVPNEYIQIN